MKNKQQAFLAIFMALIIAGGFSFNYVASASSHNTLLVRGDNSGNEASQARVNNEDDGEDENEGDDDMDEVEQDEDGLNEHVKNWVTTDLYPSTTVVTAAAIQTYSDVMTVLKADQQTVNSLVASTNATNTLEASLSAGENNLLTALISKYKNIFNTVKVRGMEINLQLYAVMSVVEPLGTGTVAPILKNIIISVLKDFSEEIKDLGELARQSVGVISAETAPAPAVTPSPTPITTGPTTYTMAQVNAAGNAQKCWTVVNGTVYNMSAWIAQHPGGSQAILGMCGKDGTAGFMGQHGGQRNPTSVLASYKIGVLK
jgi:cytochrome b involved in lipid metabolism